MTLKRWRVVTSKVVCAFRQIPREVRELRRPPCVHGPLGGAVAVGKVGRYGVSMVVKPVAPFIVHIV